MKLLIADDHTLFRDALVQYISRSDPNYEVALAKDFYGAFSILEDDPHQDLVILDLRMPGMNGLEGFEKIRSSFPNQRVALMSGVAEDKDVQDALNLGAVGYFPKTMSGKALLKAVHSVVHGEIYVPEGTKTRYMPSYYGDIGYPQSGKGDAQSAHDFQDFESFHLTPRESEVLSYLVDGASNKEIANALNLQVVTVKLHVRGVCRKLEAKNRTQAALKAKELGVQPVSQQGA